MEYPRYVLTKMPNGPGHWLHQKGQPPESGTGVLLEEEAAAPPPGPSSVPPSALYDNYRKATARKVWRFLTEQDRLHEYPSMREIVKACALSSTSVASYAVKKLVSMGVVRVGRARTRGIRVLVPYMEREVAHAG